MPRQTTLTKTAVAVQPTEQGQTLVFTDTVSGDVTLYPMDAELASNVGRALIAPSIEVVQSLPTNGHHRSEH